MFHDRRGDGSDASVPGERRRGACCGESGAYSFLVPAGWACFPSSLACAVGAGVGVLPGFSGFEARMRWGVLPSDGHRISGILEGYPFVVGEQRSDWVMFVFRPFIPAGSLGRVRDWGEPLRSARIPRPVSPLGAVEYSSPMLLLLGAVPVLASRLTHVDASEVPDGIVSGR